jgi:hypothetical protein
MSGGSVSGIDSCFAQLGLRKESVPDFGLYGVGCMSGFFQVPLMTSGTGM